MIALYGIQVGAYLMAKASEATQGQLLGCWTRKFPFEIQLLAGHWDLKLLIRLKNRVILTPEIPIMIQVMLEKQANKEGSAQKCSLIKWKWFVQEYATRGIQGGTLCIHKQVNLLSPRPKFGNTHGAPSRIVWSHDHVGGNSAHRYQLYFQRN